MALPTQAEVRALLEKVVGYSTADDCTASYSETTQGNIRYARNEVSTSGVTKQRNLGVSVAFGKRSGTATVNEFDDESLRKAVRRAEELAKLAPENPEYMPDLGPQQYQLSKAYFDSTAGITPAQRADVALAGIQLAKQRNLVAAGFLEDDASLSAFLNKRGNFGYFPNTEARFTLTMRTDDGTGSGYVSSTVADFATFDAKAKSAIAAEKALASRNAKALEPGKYTVILEPLAATNLIGLIGFSMNARNADEGRSFLSKKGGGTRVGEQLVDPRVNIYSDHLDPRVPGNPWAGDGRPQRRTVWFDKGVVRNLFYTRYWAQKQGVAEAQAVPGPANLIMEGGDQSLEELIRGTERGILVTRFWYIRPVDPQTLLYTGLTRDGTFYVENGKIVHAVKNFRFNESPIIMLNNLDALGRAERVEGNSLMPAMRVRDFTFTSLSDAV